MRARLASVAPAEAQAAGRAIADRLVGRAAWRRALRIALFVSRTDEIETAPLIDFARRAQKPVLAPRILEGSEAGLEFVEVDDWSRLESGRFGKQPPASWPATALGPSDLVVVPGLAFDREGGRLGRGGGYYDRVLSGRSAAGRAIFVGVGFHFQLVDRVPMMAHDRRLDAIVTDGTEIGGALESVDPAS